MTHCPHCNAPLTQVGKFLICESEHGQVGTVYVDHSSSWHISVSKNNTLWSSAMLESDVPVISEEYRRLRALFSEGQTYGALLQTKDVFEEILKLPTLLLLSHLYSQRESLSDEAKKIFVTLLQKPLSLGDWETISKLVCGGKKAPKIDYPPSLQFLVDILNQVRDLYNEHHITKWRNAEIGHGALGFDSSSTFQQDIQEKLSLLAKHFDEQSEKYKKIRLVADDKQPHLILEDERLPLSPYILHIAQDDSRMFFFFDSFLAYKGKRTSLLNYQTGVKQDDHISEFEHLDKELEIDQKSGARGCLEDEVRDAEHEVFLEKMLQVDEFRKPTYLVRWLKDSIGKHPKGIFLLQMDRGMGKSTFTRALDQLNMNEIELKDLDGKEFVQRAYYINDLSSYRATEFASSIGEDVLNKQLVAEERSKTLQSCFRGSLPNIRIVNDLDTTRHEVAKLINEYAGFYRARKDKGPLLLILDGLDEIPASEELTILDLIPSPELLAEGVYILLTCRNSEEITKDRINQIEIKLKRLEISETKKLHKDDPDNTRLLSEYIRDKNKDHKIDEETVNKLLEISDQRFVYLRLLREILRLSPELLSDLPETHELLALYLRQLESRYGEKYFQTGRKLLLVMTIAKEPLTLQEICFLMGEPCTTYKLKAYMNDLHALFKVDRSFRGNLYSLNHVSFQEYLENTYEASFVEIVTQWACLAIDYKDSNRSILTDGESWLFANLNGIVREYIAQVTSSFANVEEFLEWGSFVLNRTENVQTTQDKEKWPYENYSEQLSKKINKLLELNYYLHSPQWVLYLSKLAKQDFLPDLEFYDKDEKLINDTFY